MQKLKVAIRTPKEPFGWEAYTVFVDVSNTTESLIDDVSVVPQVVPGVLLGPGEGPENVELQELERKKRKIVREMEVQASFAYERKALRDMSPTTRVVMLLADFLTYATLDIGSKLTFVPFRRESARSSIFFPDWATEAMQIEDWNDIERMEQDIMVHEKQDSFLRKAFSINKEKLRGLMERLDKIEAQKKNRNNLKDVYSIQPAATISFPFKARSPLVFRVRDYELQFMVSYKDPQPGTTGSFSANQKIYFYPSSAVISFGVLVGAIGGFLTKVSLVSQQAWFTQSFWANLVGTTVLAFVVAFLTVRTPDSKKPITAEDFFGGFILGALTGIFSEAILVKLKGLVASI